MVRSIQDIEIALGVRTQGRAAIGPSSVAVDGMVVGELAKPSRREAKWRTTHELITGHKMKLPLPCFGETSLWRQQRSTSNLGRHDSEWTERVFLGMSGTSAELVFGTKEGAVRTKDVRMLSDQGARFNSEFVLGFGTAFEQYVDPQQMLPERIIGAPANVEVGDLPKRLREAWVHHWLPRMHSLTSRRSRSG